MNRSPSNRVGGAVLALAAAALPAWAQDGPAKADPAKQNPALEALLAAASRSNPDVVIAEAKVREGEALLFKARNEARRKILELYKQRQPHREEEAWLLGELEKVKKVGQTPGEVQKQLEAAHQLRDEKQIALAEVENKLKAAQADLQGFLVRAANPEKEPAFQRLKAVIAEAEATRAKLAASSEQAGERLRTLQNQASRLREKPSLEQKLAKVRMELARLDAELTGVVGAPLTQVPAPAPKPAPAKDDEAFHWTPTHDKLRQWLATEGVNFKVDPAWVVQDAIDHLQDRYKVEGFVIRGRKGARREVAPGDPWEVKGMRLDQLLLLLQDEVPGLQFHVLEYGLVIDDEEVPPERAVRLQDFLKMKPPTK